MSYRDLFMVKPGSAPKLSEIDPDYKDPHEDKPAAESQIAADIEELRELQYLLYAENQRSLLICLQAPDAGGKDGTIRHVLGAMNPQSARVHAFKVPTPEEAAHDFLWRVHRQTPAIREVVVFNRSHYEGVLVERVHRTVPKAVWSKRYDFIDDFEKNLVEARTHILKFYLHISKDEQLRRFEQRLKDPRRQWKISEEDYADRALWSEYEEAYEDVFSKTSTKHAPWFIVPANHKWFRDLVVGRIVVEELESFGMKFPPPSVDLHEIRRKYHAESDCAKSAR